MDDLISDNVLTELKRSLEGSNARDILKNIHTAIQRLTSPDDLRAAVDILEDRLFNLGESYLFGYLFLLYDRLGEEYMARFCLRNCDNGSLSQRELAPAVNKYLSLAPKTLDTDYRVYNGEFTYVYEGEERSYAVHSFSNSIGCNLTLLITPYGSIILDCGAKCVSGGRSYIEADEARMFLRAYGVEPKDVAGVLISHGHLDHWGSISSLVEIGVPLTRFYTDERTKEIIRDSSPDIDIEQIRPISSFFVPNWQIGVHAYDNGHILGSQLFVIGFDDKTVVFTGDFCIHGQYTADGLDIGRLTADGLIARGVDCLITESTCGNDVTELLPYEAAERALMTVIQKLTDRGYKILLPALSIGRAQELILMLKSKYRLLIDGNSVKLTQTYERIMKIPFDSSNVRYSVDDDCKIGNLDFNDIIIAGPNMLSEGSLSAEYMRAILDSRERVAIIRTGYRDGGEEIYGDGVYREWRNRGRLIIDAPLSVHASYDELFTLINALAPKSIVAVHGGGIAHRRGAVGRTEKRITVTDAVIMSRRNALVVLGRDRIGSEAFNTAFMLFVKSVRAVPGYRFIAELMNGLETDDELWEFICYGISDGG